MKLTDEQIHELARDMAIDLMRGVVDLNAAAIEAIYSDDGDALDWSPYQQRLTAKPHVAAVAKFSPFLLHLCSPACAYGWEGKK